jgi:signal transduction histidine kinase
MVRTNSPCYYGTNNEKGTVIGLNLCKNIIDKLGGDISVENNKKGGSSFSFSLPIS